MTKEERDLLRGPAGLAVLYKSPWKARFLRKHLFVTHHGVPVTHNGNFVTHYWRFGPWQS